MEPGEQAEEEEDEEEDEEERVPPIATTPPRRSWKEESLSHSSSETQASVTSGISLGEEIRQKVAINQGIESWYQLPAAVDASRLTAASETKLCLTCDRNDLTEFPTLEEGVLPSAEASGRQFPGDTAHGLLLDIQDSLLSPRLPLLTYSTQGQRFSDETLFQQSGMNFIPLRGVPDVSGVSEERSKPLPVSEAVSLTDMESPSDVSSFTLSQHPLPLSHVEPCGASCSGFLSQPTSFSGKLLVSKETNEDCKNCTDEEALIPRTSDNLAHSTAKVMLMKANRLNQMEASLAKQICSTSVKGEHFSPNSNVPTTVFELSEKDRQLLRHDEFLSLENYSCKTALTKNSEKSERAMQKENVKMAESESEGCTKQLEKLGKAKKVPELDMANNLSDLKKDNCKNSDAQDVFSAKASETGGGMWKEHGVDLNGSETLKAVAVTEELQGAFLDHQQKQLSPVVRSEKGEFIPTVTSTSDCAPKQLVVTDMEAPPSWSERAPVEGEPGVSRTELTISDFSIERGHKVAGISPSFNLVGDGSFSVHFAHPSYQSTPGILLKKNVKAEELGVLVIKSDTQASPSCLNEETSGSSSTSKPVPIEKQHSLQCAQKDNSKHFESFKLKYPHTGRIQSLPSLSFMEKVGAWNVSQPEELSDVVTSCDPGGVSPTRKAYSAITSSLNNILSIQKSSRDPTDDVAPTSRGTGSLGSLRFHNKNLLLVHHLTRSQSDNAVNVSSRNTSLAEVTPPANLAGAVQPLEEKSNVLGVSESLGGSMIQKFTANIAYGSSSEDAEGNSTGQSSDPNVFVSSEEVAQLLREDGDSPADDQKNSEALENQSQNLNIPAGHVSKDSFGDISPDSLNLPVSSGDSNKEGLGSAECSSVVSRHFFASVNDENFVPVGATDLETPEKKELNIEERIPIYLHNLGIDQSPGTILMPFVPRGPIREVEFSPSELRTLKDSTDMLTRTTPQPQAWVKLKLASRSQESVSDFNEEDQQRIEEIKAELLLSARKYALAKDPCVCGLEAASEYSRNQEQDIEHFKTPSNKRFQTDKHSQAVRTKELSESSLRQAVPLYRADPSDGCLLKDMQFKSLSTVQTPICNQCQTAASHSDAIAELHPPLEKEWDTRAMRSAASPDIQTEVHLPAQKKLSTEKSSEDLAKQITSITFSSRKRLQSPLTFMALDSGLSSDGLDGIMPLDVDPASTEEQRCDKHWERSKTCPPSPMLAGSVSNEIAYSAEKDRFHVSADSNRVGAYQETDCLSDQDCVSIHADKRQTLSAKNSDVLPQDAAELGRHTARLVGIDCDTRVSQEMNRFNEAHSVSSYQQEKSSPPGHMQLYERSEGSGPAVQTDLLKTRFKLLAKEKKSPSDKVPLTQKEAARKQIGMSHHSSTDEILSTTSVSPSSPTKKALSCVHITLSTKCNNSELHSGRNTEHEMKSGDKPEVNTQLVSLKTPETLLEAVPQLSPADLIPEDQRSSSFPIPVSSADACPVLSSVTSTAGQELPLQSSESPQVTVPGSRGCCLKNTFNSVAPAKSGKSTSDASTQITTESPEKTTFSAEIYVNSQGSENAVHQSSLQKTHELPNNATSSLDKISSFPRQGDQPLLLPYKPSGSTGMYYVPYLKAGSKISPAGSETSVESSHSGSNDALPSRFLANVLDLRGDNPPDSTAIKHKEVIYSKRAKPKLAWAEEQMIPLEATAGEGHTDHLKSVKPTHSVFKSSRFYLHHPMPVCESYFLSNSELSEDSSGIGYARPPSSAVLQNWKKPHWHQRGVSVHHKKDGENEFFPLTVEADYSKNEDLNASASLGNETSRKELLQHGRRAAERKAARNYPLPCSQTTCLSENVEKDLPRRQRTHSSGSLDELWIKFLECQKRHQHRDFRSNSELSLVERLHRLARVLQNPIKHIIIPTTSEKNISEKKIKGREPKEIRLPEQSMSESTLEPNATCVEERPHITHDKNSFVKLRKNRSGEKIIRHMNKILEHQQCLETPSDTSSESRLSRDHGTMISSTASESDAVTQTEMETATQTEASSSISTIDTARLIRAFGHERVQVSPRLSQLYYTINHQKCRCEKWDKRSGKAVGVEYPKVPSERAKKRKEIQNAISLSSDSTSSSACWGPSSALSNKRRTRMLNKGIQAGDLEIVNSATKKNTRDVGVTFPTPGSSQLNQQPQEPWHCVDGNFGESDGVVTDHQAARSKDEQKGEPGNFFVEKRMKRSRLHLPQGISWFVQAEDLKSESRKENHSNSFSGPGPSWFEPLTSTKPWREPLQKKNWKEQQHGNMIQPAVPEGDAGNRSSRSLGKLTLQEALAVHRPDFISRSGERVKHLKLVMEERRIQSVLQSKREELLNPPEKRKGYRNASHMLSDRGFLFRENRRTIPKSEMVLRSKRIYEQLPEVQKKREEEKRKMEYRSYRLKAQLYKTKITNRVLGRKVPWN
ncbi:Alstrom syndrome protein 1 isoform X5 [Falco rusticolus]|uniref:Alstrom syndrome protein 1 isoform X5 n=1 Tax=Falco rusticolus TaxID=120794 RepID=UPI00188690DF|nr:Alstrom syndrome protein 1 isoform X5 [Falco rusticolus]